MRFALLGHDPHSLRMARAVIQHPNHELVAVYEPDSSTSELLQFVQTINGVSAAKTGQWELLLSGNLADAVIVSSQKEPTVELGADRDDQLRKLVQAGVSLLVSHPACESIVAFELDMIRRDTGCLMQAFSSAIGHPAVETLAFWREQSDKSPIGSVEELAIERACDHNDLQSVMQMLAGDATTIRRIAGALTKVATIGGIPENGGPIQINAGIANENIPMVRWSIVCSRPRQRCSSHLLMSGSRGRAVLNIADENGRWSLNVEGAESNSATYGDYDAYSSQLNRFVTAMQTREADPPWIDISRDLEVAEATKRSVIRGRQVDLYQDEPTEAGTFKGVMAAGGCLLLMLSLMVLVGAGIVEGLRLPFRNHFLWRIWPVYLVAPLLFFLLLQTLNFVAGPTKTETSAADNAVPPER